MIIHEPNCNKYIFFKTKLKGKYLKANKDERWDSSRTHKFLFIHFIYSFDRPLLYKLHENFLSIMRKLFGLAAADDCWLLVSDDDDDESAGSAAWASALRSGRSIAKHSIQRP